MTGSWGMRKIRFNRSRAKLLALLLYCSSWCASDAWAGDGVGALQTAAASCADDSGDRYVDCGNGTVTDNDTGLVWLANADCMDGVFDWFMAMGFAAGLGDNPAGSAAAADDCGLSDGSSAGEWRLPSIEEWEAMVAGASALGCFPKITNDAGDGCWDEDCVTAGACSFSGVVSSFYWSASTRVADPTLAWLMNLTSGTLSNDFKVNDRYIWPVRAGQ